MFIERSQSLPPPHLRESAPDISFGENTSELPATSSSRKCEPFQIDFCLQLPYNHTTFPNGLSHRSAAEAAQDLEHFKSVPFDEFFIEVMRISLPLNPRAAVDTKCHTLGYEFLCQILQPVCYLDQMVLPCKDFCVEFMESCADALPDELRGRINCEEFATEADGPGACISKPGKLGPFFY